MKFAKLLLPAILVGLLMNAAVMAKDGDEADKPKAAAIQGTIAKIDGQSVTITRQKDGGASEDVTLTVDAKTKIMVDGQPGELSKLKAGDKVRGAYNDSKVAIYIATGAAKGGDKK